MAALQFDGIDDLLVFTALDTPLQNIEAGGWTYAALVNRGTLSQFQGVLGLVDSVSGFVINCIGFCDAGTGFTEDALLCRSFGDAANNSTALSDTTDSYVIVVSKADGTATPRSGWSLNGAAMTHQNMDASLAEIGSTPDNLEIGHSSLTGEYFGGHVGLVGIYDFVLSDGQKESLITNWQTSDWWDLGPQCLIECNVGAAGLFDMAGNASGVFSSGVSLDSGQTMNGWNFNGDGGGGGGFTYDHHKFKRPWPPTTFGPF